MGKGEIARNEQFLLFPQCFLLNQIIVSPFVYIFDVISLFAAELEEPKISVSGKGLTKTRVRIHKLFLRTSFRFCRFERDTTSDWLKNSV